MNSSLNHSEFDSVVSLCVLRTVIAMSTEGVVQSEVSPLNCIVRMSSWGSWEVLKKNNLTELTLINNKKLLPF